MKKLKYVVRTPARDRVCDTFRQAVEAVDADITLSITSREKAARLIELHDPIPQTGIMSERTLILYGRNDRKSVIFPLELP